MDLINLTPHALTVMDDQDVAQRQIQPSGDVARVEMEAQLDCAVDYHGFAIPTYALTPSPVSGLPAPSPGVCYIVSGLVGAAVGSQRRDLLVPYHLVRDDAGRIIGCRAFSRP